MGMRFVGVRNMFTLGMRVSRWMESMIISIRSDRDKDVNKTYWLEELTWLVIGLLLILDHFRQKCVILHSSSVFSIFPVSVTPIVASRVSKSAIAFLLPGSAIASILYSINFKVSRSVRLTYYDTTRKEKATRTGMSNKYGQLDGCKINSIDTIS